MEYSHRSKDPVTGLPVMFVLIPCFKNKNRQRQREGGPIEEIRPGDVVWFAPNEKHWHGASPQKAMSHIAIQEEKDGSAVTWMEKVTDEQYVK